MERGTVQAKKADECHMPQGGIAGGNHNRGLKRVYLIYIWGQRINVVSPGGGSSG